jgi:hypothetical protein
MVAERNQLSVFRLPRFHTSGPILLVAETEQEALMLKVALRVAGFPDQILFTTGFNETVDYFTRVTQYADPSVYPEPGMVMIFTGRLEHSHFELLSGLEIAWRIPTVVVTNDPDIHLSSSRSNTRYLPRPSAPDNLVDLLREAVGDFYSLPAPTDKAE